LGPDIAPRWKALLQRLAHVEQDIAQLAAASDNGWKVTALFDEANGAANEVPNLEIAYLDTDVDVDSRTMKLFVGLPNEVTHEKRPSEGVRFVSWRYRPGQRLQLRIPVEQWEQQIVLPIEAVAREGWLSEFTTEKSTWWAVKPCATTGNDTKSPSGRHNTRERRPEAPGPSAMSTSDAANTKSMPTLA